MIPNRRRRRTTQAGYVTRRFIQGEPFWIGNYSEYPRNPETGEPERLHRTLTEPLGKVAKMTEAAAKKKCARLVAEKLGLNAKDKDGRVSFQWFAENEYLKSNSPGWARSTNETKKGDLKNYIYPFLGSLALEEITLQVLKDNFLNQLGEEGRDYSEDTVKRAKTLVSTILDYAVECGYLIGNPAASRRYKLPRVKGRNRSTATMADIGRFMHAVQDDRDLVVMKLAQAGAGPAEIFSMEMGAVNLDDLTAEPTIDDYIEIRNSAYRGRLVRGKTKTDSRPRKAWVDSVRMKAALLRLMDAARDKQASDLLFPSRVEGRTIWSGTYLKKRIRPIAKQLDIRVPITFRVLRRSFATWMQKSLAQRLEVIQVVMGHKKGSEVTEKRYIQPDDQKAQALALEYAMLCEQEAKRHSERQQLKKATLDAAKAEQLTHYREVSGAVQ